jgi:hypothetical protein
MFMNLRWMFMNLRWMFMNLRWVFMNLRLIRVQIYGKIIISTMVFISRKAL